MTALSQSPFSPSLTPTSSSSRPHTDIDNLPDLDIPMDGVPDFNDIFNFDEFDSSGNDSHSATPPNPTPSPIPAQSPLAFTPSLDMINAIGDDFKFDFLAEEAKLAPNYSNAGPSSMFISAPYDVKVKEEPLDLGSGKSSSSAWGLGGFGGQYDSDGTGYLNVQVAPSSAVAYQPQPQVQSQAQPQADVSAATPDFSALPVDQQLALQQLMFNIMAYQQQFGFAVGGNGEKGVDQAYASGYATQSAPQQQPQQRQVQQQPQPTTVQPSLLFSKNPPYSNLGGYASVSPGSGSFTGTDLSPTSQFVSNASNTPASENAGLGQASSSTSAAKPTAAPARRASSSVEEDEEDDEDLIAIEPHEQNRLHRSDSIFSSIGDDIDSKLGKLAPLSSIFAAGKGKGGKKGGGLSSVVRQEDEEVDDDDSWRPSPEEYKKLSSKEKRQLRNKLSARAFRNRRKDYIGTLEGHIKERDGVIDEMKAELVNSRNENQDLRRELAILKASTMAVLHPESANKSSESPAIMNALAMPSMASMTAAAPKKAVAPTVTAAPSAAPTPSFNPRKDLPSSSALNKTKWSNETLFGNGGGSTICHTLLTSETPDPAVISKTPPFTLPRTNLNPRLSDRDRPNTVNLQGTSINKDAVTGSFADWASENAFSLRTMDTYRMQMWSRLAREAQADKSGIEAGLRPKFFVDPTSITSITGLAKAPTTSSTSATTVPGDVSSAATISLAASHITSKLASSFWSAFAGSNSKLDTDKLTAVVTGKARLRVVDIEKERQEREDDLINALGALRLQGSTHQDQGPIGAIASHLGVGLGLGAGAERRNGGAGASAREDPLRAIAGGFLRMTVGIAARA